MKKLSFLAFAIVIAVCAIALSSCKEKPAGELFIHYTPEELDPKTQAVIDGMKSNSMFPTTAEEMAADAKELAGYSYEEYSAVYPPFSDEYQLDSIIDENGYKILKLTYNGNRENSLPEANLIYTHGGGFMYKMGESHRNICQRLARQMNFTVYIPLFPCAPNYYVQTTLDMLTGLYKKVIADGKPVYIMGDSAGGNITLAFGLYLKSIGEKLPDAILGISPLCDLRQNSPELIEANKKDIMMTPVLMHEVSTHWKTEDMSYEDPRVSPLYGDWTGMPQTFLFVGTDESLYPEIMQIAGKMKDSGMRVGMLVGNGLFHIAPLMPIPVMDQYFDEITEFLYGSCDDSSIKPLDYSQAENWMIQSPIKHEVDLFFIYPTSVDDNCTSFVSPVDSAMRAKAYISYLQNAECFSGYTNVFVPYYRQLSLVGLTDDKSPEGIIKNDRENEPWSDIKAALDYYFTELNTDRPVLFASHSQGSALMHIVMDTYLKEHPQLRDRIVAVYAIGYQITPEWCGEVGIPFATGEEDTGVILTWNTEGPGVTANNTVFCNSLGINPLNWKTDTTYAGLELNKGSLAANEKGELIKVPGRADARFCPERGTIICSTDTNYLPTNPMFGEKSFHFEDGALFYQNMKENGRKRIAAYLGHEPR